MCVSRRWTPKENIPAAQHDHDAIKQNALLLRNVLRVTDIRSQPYNYPVHNEQKVGGSRMESLTHLGTLLSHLEQWSPATTLGDVTGCGHTQNSTRKIGRDNKNKGKTARRTGVRRQEEQE